jgi:hypothetical protein
VGDSRLTCARPAIKFRLSVIGDSTNGIKKARIHALGEPTISAMTRLPNATKM